MSLSFGGYTASGKECVVCTRPVPVFVLAPQSQLLWNSFTFGQGHQGQVDVTVAVLANRLTNYFEDLTRNTTRNDFCSNCCLSKLDLRENVTCTESIKFRNLLNQLVVSINGTIDKIQNIFTPAETGSTTRNENDLGKKSQGGRIQHHMIGNASSTTDDTSAPSSPPYEFSDNDDERSLNNVTADSPVYSEVEISPSELSDAPKQRKQTKRSKGKKSKLKKDAGNKETEEPNPNKFACNICKKVLSAQVHLDSHMLLHSNEKPFECTICYKKFRHNPALFLHVRAHQGIKPYVCDVCERPFSTKWKMTQHRLTHTREKPVLCELCPKQYLSLTYLRGHMRTAHPETFGDKYAPENRFKCNFCDRTFLLSYLLRIHELSRHKIDERPLACEICGKRYRTQACINRHMKEVHLKVPRQVIVRKHKCVECDKMCLTPSSLKEHMKAHENAKPVKCEICSAKVPRKLVKSHLKHHENPDRRLRSRKNCSRQRECRKIFVSSIKEDSSSNFSLLAMPKLEKEVEIRLARVDPNKFDGMDDIKEEVTQEDMYTM